MANQVNCANCVYALDIADISVECPDECPSMEDNRAELIKMILEATNRHRNSYIEE